MKVSHRGLYALQALIHLAEAYDTGLVVARTVAEKEGIPEKFLEGILLALKNARVISSERGREGGYRLQEASRRDLHRGRGADDRRPARPVRGRGGAAAPRQDRGAPRGTVRAVPRGAQRGLGHRGPHEPRRPGGAQPPGPGRAGPRGAEEVTRPGWRRLTNV